MRHTVKIHTNSGTIVKKAETGTNLLAFLRENRFNVPSPCGGNGKCGKCGVVAKGLKDEPSAHEKSLLGTAALEKGYRLSCLNSIKSDMDVYISGKDDEEARIVTEGSRQAVELDPVVLKKYAELVVPSIGSQEADIERILQKTGAVGLDMPIGMLREVPGILREADFKVTAVNISGRLAAVEPGNTSERFFGLAMDIGTTTIAAYLFDMSKGAIVDIYSTLNPQRKFGADVLSRIDYTVKSGASLNEMKKAVVDCVNSIIEYFEAADGVKSDEIYEAVFAGNTTMMHFLMGVTAQNIAVSPFVPATVRAHKFRPEEIGIRINRYGCAVIMPSVSGYIGADIVAGVLSTGIYKDDKTSLLIDIGTNGEVVLGNNKWLFACSTAAGPAFEGANIRNGVGGVKGAVDRVHFGEKLEYTTIGNAKAIGICGSGIVDAIAGMLLKNVIDETGRIAGLNGTEGIMEEEYGKRIIDIGGLKAFLVVNSDESATGSDIAVTQKDVRELQNAKAAIAAGIKTLAKQAGIKLGDIDRVCLAGGFGSYINIENAIAIGLIPRELKGKVESVGNSAGAGAVLGLLSWKMLDEADKIRNKIKYIELSASSDFANEYINNMTFESS